MNKYLIVLLTVLALSGCKESVQETQTDNQKTVATAEMKEYTKSKCTESCETQTPLIDCINECMKTNGF